MTKSKKSCANFRCEVLLTLVCEFPTRFAVKFLFPKGLKQCGLGPLPCLTASWSGYVTKNIPRLPFGSISSPCERDSRAQSITKLSKNCHCKGLGSRAWRKQLSCCFEMFGSLTFVAQGMCCKFRGSNDQIRDFFGALSEVKCPWSDSSPRRLPPQTQFHSLCFSIHKCLHFIIRTDLPATSANPHWFPLAPTDSHLLLCFCQFLVVSFQGCPGCSLHKSWFGVGNWRSVARCDRWRRVAHCNGTYRHLPRLLALVGAWANYKLSRAVSAAITHSNE